MPTICTKNFTIEVDDGSCEPVGISVLAGTAGDPPAGDGTCPNPWAWLPWTYMATKCLNLWQYPNRWLNQGLPGFPIPVCWGNDVAAIRICGVAVDVFVEAKVRTLCDNVSYGAFEIVDENGVDIFPPYAGTPCNNAVPPNPVSDVHATLWNKGF